MSQPRVWFVGAGPGDPELVTVKGLRLIRSADLVLYAGSLVPRELAEEAKEGARVEDSAPLDLQQTHALLMECVRAGGTAVRLHTGDPSLYGAVREQMRLLDGEGVEYGVVPGVTAAFAAAAEARASLTVPGRVQSVVFTRAGGRTPVPESLRQLAATGACLAIYLSAPMAEGIRDELLAAGLPPETAVVVAHKVGWPGQATSRTTLENLPEAAAPFTRQTLFLVLPGETGGETRSSLYNPDFAHGFRKLS
ncbi:precorrin-4 C(11)-methyltransferase [Desulfohalovibrio reitneri]|uniref:precorrin-4 C(11)-methyltransferase n=1 Tax=Desulfohalovibrio reitneri TaxID=1307759 RepID=UPI0004A75D9E|nr:precorrin-4 C(11)-methyltransferase [Desulfohalovibrio reitneri]